MWRRLCRTCLETAAKSTSNSDAVIRDAAAENKDQWDQVINDFVANDPQVGNLQLDTGANQPADSAKKFDCFYLPLNYVPQIDMTTILNLDPFIDADPCLTVMTWWRSAARCSAITKPGRCRW